MAVYAEDVNYWKTGTKTSTEKWMDDAKAEIQGIGGIAGVGCDAKGVERWACMTSST